MSEAAQAEHLAYVQAAWGAGFESNPELIPNVTDCLDVVANLLVQSLPADVHVVDQYRTDYPFGSTVVGLQLTSATQTQGVESFSVAFAVTSPTRAGGWGVINLCRRVVFAAMGSGVLLHVEDEQLPILYAGFNSPNSVYQHNSSMNISIQQGELL